MRGIEIDFSWISEITLHLKRLLDAAQSLEQRKCVAGTGTEIIAMNLLTLDCFGTAECGAAREGVVCYYCWPPVIGWIKWTFEASEFHACWSRQ